jgi:ABC-type proline/glycine betaine transport system substrate-binding protein
MRDKGQNQGTDKKKNLAKKYLKAKQARFDHWLDIKKAQ